MCPCHTENNMEETHRCSAEAEHFLCKGKWIVIKWQKDII